MTSNPASESSRTVPLKVVLAGAAASVLVAAMAGATGFVVGQDSRKPDSEVNAMVASTKDSARVHEVLALERQRLRLRIAAKRNAKAAATLAEVHTAQQSGSHNSSSYSNDASSTTPARSPSKTSSSATDCIGLTPAACSKQLAKLPKTIVTPGTPPPADGKAPAGGSGGTTFN